MGRMRVGGAGSHGVAMGCEKGAPLGRILVGVRVPHGNTIPRRHRKRSFTFDMPNLDTAVPAHRRCISLASPRQRRGKTVPFMELALKGRPRPP